MNSTRFTTSDRDTASSKPKEIISSLFLSLLINDLKYLCSEDYDGDNMKYEQAKIMIDNEAAISMARCNKDTVRNRHVARRFHYVRQGTVLDKHKFH